MSKNNFKELIFPPLALVLICLVVTAILSLVFNLTEPTIEAHKTNSQSLSAQEVLPKGEGFIEKKGTVDGVTSYFQSMNDEGIAVLATEKSFGGTMDVMVGIDTDGEVTSVKIVSHTDTPGLGDLPMTEEELSQYKRVSQLDGEGTKESDTIDGVTGATVSSDAIFRSVKSALDQWNAL